jgi:ATP-dependent Clp protease ATP-binding subunit ClpA
MDTRCLTSEHLFMGCALVEWQLFSEGMRSVEMNPYQVLRDVEEHLRTERGLGDGDVRVAPTAKLVCRLARRSATRAGRQALDAADLLAALFEETQGVAVSIVRRHGVEANTVVTALHTRLRERELRDEHLKKRFELPPYLRQFATNLNMLARQDKLPPVFGRNLEIQQVIEILCQRERANSVMLLGEPGVGKTAT